MRFSEDGRARAGMGADAADVDNSGTTTVVVTNFSGEMLGLYRPVGDGQFEDAAPRSDVGRATRQTLGFGCFFFDVDLDGLQDLLVVNGHIDDTFTRANRPRRLRGAAAPVPQPRSRAVHRHRSSIGGDFAQPKVGRGAAFADIDGDRDLDVVITTNGGPARLYRNDSPAGNRALRVHLRGVKSNRDGIGARVRVFAGRDRFARTVKTGSSYLSQSELPLTFGLGAATKADQLVVEWPSGKTDEIMNLAAGKAYLVVEGKGVLP